MVPIQTAAHAASRGSVTPSTLFCIHELTLNDISVSNRGKRDKEKVYDVPATQTSPSNVLDGCRVSGI